MNEIKIKDLIDDNYRILILLGYASGLVMELKGLHAYHDSSDKCDWLLQAINDVIYLRKPLPLAL